MKNFTNTLSRALHHRGLGILILRVATGSIFFVHGWDKWHNIDATVRMMNLLGFASWTAYFIAGLEVVGGLALMAGVATRLFGLLFGIEMAVAAWSVNAHMPRGFHGFEVEMLLSAASLCIMFAGPGAFALWRWGCSKCGGAWCKGACNLRKHEQQ